MVITMMSSILHEHKSNANTHQQRCGQANPSSTSSDVLINVVLLANLINPLATIVTFDFVRTSITEHDRTTQQDKGEDDILRRKALCAIQ